MRNKNPLQNFDVLIIGAGPAGCSAAVYTARAGLKTIVFGLKAKSHISKGHAVANYFGFSKPVTGTFLLGEGRVQAENFGAAFVEKEIIDVKKAGELIDRIRMKPGVSSFFVATDTDKKKYQSKTVVICSGLGFKKSGIKKEKELAGAGVSWCAVCDGFFFKNKKIAVIGNANFAAEEALHLASYTKDITILSHGKDFEFSEAMKSALEKNQIKFIKTPQIAEFLGDKSVSGLRLNDGKEMAFDGVFLAFGRATAADFSNQLGVIRTGPQNNFLAINFRTGETNVPGVYAAGDCTGGNFQVMKSAAEGCNAGISVIKFVKGIASYVDYTL